MARVIQEVMNRELLAVAPEASASEVRELLRSFVVGAAPVVDEARRPLGVVSLRDLLDGTGDAASRMSKPAVCVGESTPIEEAARRLARTAMHHLVVVDSAGTAVGMVSCVDLLRGLLGMPVLHPQTFPHWDPDTHASWSDEWPLDPDGCSSAPEGAGVLVLVTGQPLHPDTLVWAESCADVRERAMALATKPLEQEAALARCLAQPGLRARATILADGAARERIVRLLHERLCHVPPPGAT